MTATRLRRATDVLALGLALSIAPSTAWSASDDARDFSVYLEYLGGVSFVRDQNVVGADATGAGLQGKADLSTGYVVGGAIGAKFLEHFRGEIAITYNNAKVDNLAVQGEPSTAKGGLSMLAFLANGYLDFDLDRLIGLAVVPYLGVGIGYGHAEFDARNQTGATQTEVSDTDSVFVWNVMAGASVPISEAVELSLGYRYLASEDLRLEARSAGLPRRVESEFDAHQVLAGLRLNF